jgi:ribonuclease HI
LPDKIVAYIDGASRGNPGPAAAAFVLKDSVGNKVQAKAFFLGHATNNVAEYTALVKALAAIKQLAPDCAEVALFSDSELLVKQVKGEYKVKSEQIRSLFLQAVDLLAEFTSWKIQHIMRDKNKESDKLVNQALNLERDLEDKPAPRRHEPRATSNERQTIRLGVLISGGGRT